MAGLSEGCKQCVIGGKMVVFVTGVCHRHCYYCPVSEEKFGKDVIFANERQLKNEDDFESLITEAKEMRALGCSFAGGEPLLVVDRICKYLRVLKKEFGKKFHTHLYTWGKHATPENLKKLEEAGLDEIRFHLFKDPDFNRILPALETGMNVGVEIPANPLFEKQIYELVDFVKQHPKIAFMNLNELEYSDSNYEHMQKVGHKTIDDNTYAVQGSAELAYKVMAYADRPQPNQGALANNQQLQPGIGANNQNLKSATLASSQAISGSTGTNPLTVHFCRVKTKNTVQISARLRRRAETIMKPFEAVNEGGLIEKATVEGNFNGNLKKILEIYATNVWFNQNRNRIECSEKTAKEIARKFKGLRAFRLVEFPSSNPWDFEKEEIN